jgi:hypothetical protein
MAGSIPWSFEQVCDGLVVPVNRLLSECSQSFSGYLHVE